MRRAGGRVEIDWVEIFGCGSSSPDRADAFHPSSAPAARGAAAAKGVDTPRRGISSRRHHPGVEGLSGSRSSSPDRAVAFDPWSAPAARAAAKGGDELRRGVPEVAARRPSIDAAAKEDEREEEGSSASAAKKSRKHDTEKEDALLQMLGEINKSLQASLKPPEPLQVPKDASPEEIFEALRGIPRLACADLLRAYSMLIQDDRRFISLMALPKNMRKEWLLMEIGSI